VLLGVWGVLVVLTWLTVAATKVDLGHLNIVIALGIAVVKSSFVALYFMHLRYDKPFHAVVFISAALFVMLFISLTLMDTREYGVDQIPGYAPELAVPGPEAAPAAEGVGDGAAPAGGETPAEPAGTTQHGSGP